MSDPMPIAVNWERPTNKAGLERLAPLVIDKVNKALPKFLKKQADSFVQAMITECTKTPRLLDCSPASLFGGVVQAALLGLRIGGFTGESFLIPYGKKAQLVPGYRGYIQLAHRSGRVRRITPGTVYKEDRFTFVRGTRQELLHEPNTFGLKAEDRGVPVAYYCVIELDNGGTDFEAFTYDDALRHRDRYASIRGAPQHVRDNSPWYDMTGGGFDRMSEKTMIIKLGKRLPLSSEMSRAVELESELMEGGSQDLSSLLGSITEPPGQTEQPPQPEVVEDSTESLGRD